MSHFFGEPTNNGGTSLSGWPALSVVVFWFVWIVLSDYFFGRSFGNWTCNIKPVPIENPENALSFRQCIARHIFDMVDLSMIGLVILFTSNKNQRLGDMVAKTMMVTLE